MAQHHKKGFTLIEIVAALAIIAVLATLITVAASAALRFMRGVSESNDVEQIVKALEIYKQQYGEYPPDGTDREAIERHIKKRWVGTVSQTMTGTDPILTGTNFPANTTAADYMSLLSPLENNTYFNAIFDADETATATVSGERSLSFWLCGLGPRRIDRSEGATFPSNKAPQLDVFFNLLNAANSKFPEAGPPLGTGTPLVELKSGENYIETIDEADNIADGWLTDSHGNKFAYFRGGKNGFPNDLSLSVDGQTVAPYQKNGKWFTSDTYQLIFAGEDGRFGTDDDLTNFSHGKPIVDVLNGDE